MPAFRNLILIRAAVFGLILSSCQLPEPQQTRDESGATFAVTSFDGTPTAVTLHKNISLPTSNTYNFKACLNDIKQRKPMVGHKFLIEELNLELKTDIEGCLTWHETIEYNFLAVSKYLKYVRTVKALGSHKGRRAINYAIDPWSHGDKLQDAVDLSKKHLPDEYLIKDQEAVELALKGLSETQKRSLISRSLWLEQARVNSLEDRITKDGFSVTYEFHTLPQIVLTKINGERVLYDVASGEFKAKLQLIHVVLKNGSIERRVLAEESFEQVRATNKNLILRSRMNFNAPYWGHLYFSVQLQAKEEILGLEKFEGLYYFGDFRSIRGNGWLKVSSVVQNNEDFTIKKFLEGRYEKSEKEETKMSAGAAAGAEASNGRRGDTQDFSGKNQIFVPELSFVPELAKDDTGHRRTIRYAVTACVRYPIDGTPIASLPFKVTKFRQSESEPEVAAADKDLTSQQDGCFTWHEEMKVEMYDCQHYIKGFVGIKNEDLGMDQRISYYINPWLSTPLLARDELRVSQSLGNECSGRAEAEKPRYIFIGSFGVILQHMDYEIDHNLNLTVNRYVTMEIDTNVVNYSDLMAQRSGRMETRDGWYLVRTVLMTNPAYGKTRELISQSDSFAFARNGRITLDYVPFSFQKAIDIGNRNSIFVQILPVKQEALQHVKNKSGVNVAIPKTGLTVIDTIDKTVKLTPIIYEGKILLLGAEGGRFVLQDRNSSLIQNFLNSDEKAKVEELNTARIHLMDQLSQQTKANVEKNQQLQSQQGSLENYARYNGLLLMKGSEKNPALTHLHRLLNTNISNWRNYISRKTLLNHSSIEGAGTDYANVRADTQSASILEKVGTNLDLDTAKKICLFIAQNLMGAAFKNEDTTDLAKACVQLTESNLKNLLLQDTLYHVNRVGRYNFRSGSYEPINLSNSFSASFSQAETSVLSVGAELISIGFPGRGAKAGAAAAAGAGAAAAQAGEAVAAAAQAATALAPVATGLRFLDLFSLGSGGKIGLSMSTSETSGTGNAVTVTHAIPLEKQKVAFNIELTDYTKCYRFRINPMIYQKRSGLQKWNPLNLLRTNFQALLDSKKKADEVFAVINRGLLICGENQKNAPIQKTEFFYLVQQKPDNKEYLDGGDNRNRFLFMPLRGEADFLRFDTLLKSKVHEPVSFLHDGINAEHLHGQLLQSLFLRPTGPRIMFEGSLGIPGSADQTN